MNNTDNKDLLEAINAAMKGVDFSGVDPDASTFKPLADGYFLTQFDKAEFGFSKSSGKLQVKVILKIVDLGISLDVDKYGNTVQNEIKGFKGQNVYKYYNYEDADKILRFANDMSKFEGEEEGVSLIDKDAFSSAEVLLDALELLEAVKPYIYIKNDINQNDDGSTSSWVSLVSWKQARKLELPM